VRIPKGVEITVQRDVHVRAKGDKPAVIEVEGALKATGVSTREVIFENVTLEPCPKFNAIHCDSVWFRNGGGVRTPKDVPGEGYLFLEGVDLSKGAGFEVLFQSGDVKMSSICTDGPTRIRIVPPPGSKEDRVRVFLRGSGQGGQCPNHSQRIGFGGGLEVDGGEDVTIQLSRVGGDLCSVRNWGQRLIFDGMKVNATRLEFSHRKAGQFQKVQCAKLDVYSTIVSAAAPVDRVLKDTFTMDRCWFKGYDDPKVIQEKVIQDGFDDPAGNGARVSLPKINTRPLELAGSVDR